MKYLLGLTARSGNGFRGVDSGGEEAFLGATTVAGPDVVMKEEEEEEEKDEEEHGLVRLLYRNGFPHHR